MSKDWKYWLKETSKYYKISKKELLSPSRKEKRAKSTFYWLIFKSGLDLYKTSVEIGKHRSTIAKYINTNNIDNSKNRDREAEDYLLNQVK